MQRLMSALMCGVMFLAGASSVLACVLPYAQMTAEEYDCCQKMAGDCGDMANMPASDMEHSCCKKVTLSVQAAVLAAKISAHSSNLEACAVAVAAVVLPSPTTGFAPKWHLRINSPPPPAAAASITILRI